MLSTRDAKGGHTYFGFDGMGNPLWVKDVMGLVISSVYDNFGNRLSVTDPSSGTWNFTYNGYGEMLTRGDGRNRSSTYAYDVLGRAISRSWSEPARSGGGTTAYVETTEYQNVPTEPYYGTARWVQRQAGESGQANYEFFRRSFGYDALSRPTETSTQMQVGSTPALTFTSQTRYDSHFGRVKQLVYPSSASSSWTCINTARQVLDTRQVLDMHQRRQVLDMHQSGGAKQFLDMHQSCCKRSGQAASGVIWKRRDLERRDQQERRDLDMQQSGSAGQARRARMGP